MLRRSARSQRRRRRRCRRAYRKAKRDSLCQRSNDRPHLFCGDNFHIAPVCQGDCQSSSGKGDTNSVTGELTDREQSNSVEQVRDGQPVSTCNRVELIADKNESRSPVRTVAQGFSGSETRGFLDRSGDSLNVGLARCSAARQERNSQRQGDDGKAKSQCGETKESFHRIQCPAAPRQRQAKRRSSFRQTARMCIVPSEGLIPEVRPEALSIPAHCHPRLARASWFQQWRQPIPAV